MTGLGEIKLDARALAGLRKYLQAGGTLIADAAGSSRAFAEALEKQLAALLPGAAWAPLPADHPLYTRAGPAIEKVRYRRALRSLGGPARLRLKALRQGGREAVILSEFDLTAGLVGYAQWGLEGYEPDTAFALMRNAVLHAAGKTLGAAGK
jgi:hypothetical protein